MRSAAGGGVRARDDLQAGSLDPTPDGRRAMVDSGGVTRGFPPEIRRFVEFYQAFGGYYLTLDSFH